MPQINLDTPAPDFTLPDYLGNEFKLSELKGSKNVLLIFNRGFL